MKIKRFIPFVSWMIVGINLLCYAWEKRVISYGLWDFMAHDYAFNWDLFLSRPAEFFPNLFSYTFLHADGYHLLSNMIFFLIFSLGVEMAMGSALFILGYFLWGGVAAIAQGYFDPFSQGLIGASGAISGCAGAFFVMYPLKVPLDFPGKALGPWVLKIPAFFYIGLWFLSEVHKGYLFLLSPPLSTQVTLIGHWAHVGGFVAGALSMLPFFLRNRRFSNRF